MDTPRPGRIAVTGSSGLIGSALVATLRRAGGQVLPVVRSRPTAEQIGWNPEAGRLDAGGLDGLDAVVHLAGAPIGHRWTATRRRRIVQSRVRGTALLAETLARLADPPQVLVCASAVGYYGDRDDERLDEASAPGTGFLAEVTRQWEAAARPAAQAGIRVVSMRFGVVLSARGGALARMLPLFRLGLGGRLGSGRQWMSWVTLADVVGAIRFALDTPAVSGPVNTVAPEPVTNSEFTRALGRVLGRPTPAVVPATALRLVFGEMAVDTLLASQRAVPTRLQEAGFHFAYSRIEPALQAVLREG